MQVIIDADCPQLPERAEVTAGNALIHLLQCIGYKAEDPPYADLLRRFHQLEGRWIVLSPVHWQATHNDAMLLAQGKELELEPTEIQLCFDAFADYLSAEHMALYYHDAETWLLGINNLQPPSAKPIYEVLNKSLMPELADLDQSMYWQKFITESQMFFASRRNPSLLNGVWPWGGALLSVQSTRSICVDESFFPYATLCSTQVTLYQPSLDLKEYDLILLSDYSILSAHHQHQLNNRSTDWHWNNCSYRFKKPTWFTRLWRKMTDAH